MQILYDSNASLPERLDSIPLCENRLIYYQGGPSPLPAESITGLHYHGATEVGVCRSGSGICVFGGEAVAISPGDVMFVPAGTPHYSRAIDGKCACDFVFFDADMLSKRCGINPPGIEPAESYEIPYVLRAQSEADSEVLRKMRALLFELIASVIEDKPVSDRQAAAYYALFLLKLPELPPATGAKREYLCVESRLYPALRRIQVAYAGELKLTELAAECFMSVSLFSRLFMREFGMSPIAYLNRFRVRAGEQLLLHTDRSVTEISSLVGFNSPSDFYRHFVAEYGYPPSHRRKTP